MKNDLFQNEEFQPNLTARKFLGSVWQVIFLAATLVGILTLGTLLWTIIDESFGVVMMTDTVPRESLSARAGVPLAENTAAELAQAFQSGVSRGLFRRFNNEKALETRTQEELLALLQEHLIKPKVLNSWGLWDSLMDQKSIAEAKTTFEKDNAEEGLLAVLSFRSWVDGNFLKGGQSSYALLSGIRPALIGSLLTILVAILISFPIGIGSAIYLEEYAKDNRLNRLIQTNIYNLAGVPSIIYGMLGLAMFVRGLEPLTSGVLFGAVEDPTTANGRTILSAGLTLALLILPVIIINAQEALKAIPSSLRFSSYGVGATKWQTIWHHVLPASMDRILTGTVFAVSRGIGETAPLVVVGASTFLTLDPNGLFSKFTTLPIQIYQWTSRPQGEFQHIAAAAILVLMVLLLGLNSVAIIMRNKIRKQKEAGI